MKAIAAVVAVTALISGAIYLEVGVWNECRQSNSWFYCMRVLGK